MLNHKNKIWYKKQEGGKIYNNLINWQTKNQEVKGHRPLFLFLKQQIMTREMKTMTTVMMTTITGVARVTVVTT